MGVAVRGGGCAPPATIVEMLAMSTTMATRARTTTTMSTMTTMPFVRHYPAVRTKVRLNEAVCRGKGILFPLGR